MEKRAIRELAESSGARSVRMVEQALAAAVGVDLPIQEARGHMVIDVGAGTTEVAVMSLGGVVYSRNLKVGGNHMDQAIVHYIQGKHGLLIGLRTAEKLKRHLGCAIAPTQERRAIVKGRDLSTGFPAGLEVSSTEVFEALRHPVQMIVDAVLASLEHTPPELAADVAQSGIVMTGGAGCLSKLDRAVSLASSLPVIVPENAASAVVCGALDCEATL